MDLHFAWQAWHLATWTSTLRGRRGTYGTGLALVARLGWIWLRGRRRCLRGRRGTWQHRATLCVAGVALGDMDLHFAWQAWHLWHWAGSGGELGLDLAPWAPPLFAWQAWHLATWTSTLRGRRGTYGTGLALTPSLKHFVTHQLLHTIFVTPLCHTPAFTHHLSHHFVTHHVSHTIFHTPSFTHHLLHTIFKQLCHTPSFTHTTLSHPLFHTQLSHTHYLSHTTLSRTIFHTPSLTHDLSHHSVTHHLSHTVTDHLSHTTLSHTIFDTPSFTHVTDHLSHTPSFTHTHHLSPHHLSHTQLCHKPSFLHLLLCFSFLPRPRCNICCSLLEEVDLWGYPVLYFFIDNVLAEFTVAGTNCHRRMPKQLVGAPGCVRIYKGLKLLQRVMAWMHSFP